MKSRPSLLCLAALLAVPMTAGAVPVTWEAQGVVEFSDLGATFFATYLPELAGTQSGDALLLRITFDTDAALVGQTDFPNGGTTYSFNASSLVLALEVPGLGTHVFDIDPSVPPDTVSSIVGLIDNLVTGVPDFPVIDGLQFRHSYFDDEGLLQYTIGAGFSTADTSVVNGLGLPLAPDPRFSLGVEHQVSIVDPVGDGISRSLFGNFSSLVRLPSPVPEPGTLALLVLGLTALAATRRPRSRRTRWR
jgi:hypothetical protein